MDIFLAQGALVVAGLTTTRHLPVHTPSAAVSASATGSTARYKGSAHTKTKRREGEEPTEKHTIK